MEFVSPAYSARFRKAHPDWYAHDKAPGDPRSKSRWLRHRELAWDSSVRKYTPPSVVGIKPITLEPWADETLTVDSSWDRIGGSKDDIQGQLLKDKLSYIADVNARRYLKQVDLKRYVEDMHESLSSPPTSPYEQPRLR